MSNPKKPRKPKKVERISPVEREIGGVFTFSLAPPDCEDPDSLFKIIFGVSEDRPPKAKVVEFEKREGKTHDEQR